MIFKHIERPYLLEMDARTGPEILHWHINKHFQIAAANKISSHDRSASGLNRTLELFGETHLATST